MQHLMNVNTHLSLSLNSLKCKNMLLSHNWSQHKECCPPHQPYTELENIILFISKI